MGTLRFDGRRSPLEPSAIQFAGERAEMPEPRGEIEVFSAGCSLCHRTVSLVLNLAHESREVVVRDMREPEVARRAQVLGIRSVPAVVIDGKLADCCAGRGPDAEALRAAGIGEPVAQ